tara:strand:- start:242 stop:568 length:327 start_codon:yes stop_codon:yes gene_type:complete
MYNQGDKLICTQTSVIHMPMYVNMSKKVVEHTDTLISESSINDQMDKSNKMFVPVLRVESTFTDVNGKQWLKFENGQKTPKRYQLHHLHPASKFRPATISDINPRKHG